MKKEKRTILGIAVITALMGCFIAACSNPSGTGDGNSNGDEGGASYLITGKFASQTGTGDAVFYADYVSNARSVSRAAARLAATEKELTGKIEDGDIIFNLKGVYNTETEQFFLSAGSSVLIYQLAGTVSSTGGMSNTSAAVKVKQGNEWVVHEVAVTATEAAEIAGDASADQEEGIPSAWFGRWESEGVVGILTAQQLIEPTHPNAPAGLLEVNPIIPGQKYETVWQSYAYTTEHLEDGTEKETSEVVYLKATIEESGDNLKLTLYFNSVSDTFAKTQAYNIESADPDDPRQVHSAIFHRSGAGN